MCKFLLIVQAILFQASISFSQPGSLDYTFGSNGIVKQDLDSVTGVLFSLLLQSDGKIIGSGNFNLLPSGHGFGIARFNDNGSLDTSFGNSGINIVPIPDDEHPDCYTSAFQDDGKIILAGGESSWPDRDVVLMRLNGNGSIDSSFGTNGITNYAGDGDFYKVGSGMAIQQDQKIIVSGNHYGGYSTSWDFALLRFDTLGNLDPSFGGDGIVLTNNTGDSYDLCESMVLQPDGKILAVGGSLSKIAIYRYKTDGSLDYTFGDGGKKYIGYGDSIWSAYKAAIVAENKILVSGSLNNDIFFMRLGPNGKVDTTFGLNGMVTLDISSYANPKSMKVHPDGSIVFTCSYNTDFLVGRLTQDGKIDSSFGINGIVITDLGSLETAYCLAFQPDGKIIAGGVSLGDLALVRYSIDVAVGEMNSFNNPMAIMMYPNPVSEMLNFTFQCNSETQLELYDLLGKRVAEIAFIPHFQNLTLDLHHLPEGFYLATATCKGVRIWSEKVVVQR